MTSTTDSKTDRIRELNDAFRRTFVGGAVMITQGVEAMPLDQRGSLLQKIRSFDAFSEDNDPHHEHDFGSIDEAGVRCFWKIDYYDRKTEFGSTDPADPAVTTRVLTIMLADEYFTLCAQQHERWPLTRIERPAVIGSLVASHPQKLTNQSAAASPTAPAPSCPATSGESHHAPQTGHTKLSPRPCQSACSVMSRVRRSPPATAR
jgi:Protein of unknown function (DUF3768)